MDATDGGDAGMQRREVRVEAGAALPRCLQRRLKGDLTVAKADVRNIKKMLGI